MEAVRTLKANLKLEGKPCGWCQANLVLGDDAAVCTACEKEHHRRCWDAKAGCSTQGCVSAPLQRLDVAGPGGGPVVPVVPEVGPGLMTCPRCKVAIAVGTAICPACRAITSPDGIYHGLKTNAPGAVKSLVFGIIGLLVCGVVLGPLAISEANKAKQAMAVDPTLGGEGMATAGKVLGILALIGWAIALFYRMSHIQ
jgi:hypothetical protein